MPFILEGIATTQNREGDVNVAPMGPIVTQRSGREIKELLFRPFPESTTYHNLQEHPEGVFHTTDDVLLFAKAVTRSLDPDSLTFADSTTVEVPRLSSVCGWHEFRVTSFDDSGERPQFYAEVVARGQELPWMGFNRAQATVLETAILATRVHLLPEEDIRSQLPRFRTIIDKTADEYSQEAFAMLESFITSQLVRLTEQEPAPGGQV
ncbi:DUF447 domain-containing protein [Rubinisphaera sp. JC750]|uniref:DUF447 domain-containing protein n=1 Tax=Rubinisphaera sp. JC750 TaxID=2898658 RepID=UPI001F3A3650|nr:DUF447 domain-containing protein [Rubinisphaera sp. JC750]